MYSYANVPVQHTSAPLQPASTWSPSHNDSTARTSYQYPDQPSSRPSSMGSKYNMTTSASGEYYHHDNTGMPPQSTKI